MSALFVVTGTSRGLGAALAHALRARPDVQLVTLARRDADIVADLGALPGILVACEQLQARLRGMQAERAVLVNNAGVVEPVGPTGSLDAAALARNVTVNLTAPMLLTEAFLAATAGIALRRVINISSGAGRRAIAGWGPYCATKAGLDMATRVLVAEAVAAGRRVEAVSLAPGVIDTDMQATIRGVDEERFADVERFRQMKAEGTLRAAGDVARDILAHEASGALFREPVGDLRALG